VTSFGGRSRSADVLFDQHPVSGTNIADLDLELFRSTYLPAAVDPDVLAENERTPAQQLASLGMIDPKSEEARVLGLLVVGADPSSVVPGAYVQFVRYEGSDESSHVVDQEELRGNLIGQLDVLGRLLTSNIRTSVEEVGGLRQGKPTRLSARSAARVGAERADSPRLRTLQRPSSVGVV
jgi:ATP-dependent DNA helicase RecG